nr:MAG TPA: IrrE protein [Caudoviricetes sp.]
MYKYIKKNKLILINSSLSEQEQKYVLAHELGHAVLHTKSSCFCYGLNVNTYKKEYEANIFSAELLINCDEKDNTINGFSIDQLARYYNVPVGLINLKFNIN